VQVEQRHAPDAEPGEALGDGHGETRPGEPLRGAPHRAHAHLGRDVKIGVAAQRLADEALGGAFSVGVRRVEVGDATLDGALDHTPGLSVGGARPEVHGAEDDEGG
jgi:hypothetical protein